MSRPLSADVVVVGGGAAGMAAAVGAAGAGADVLLVERQGFLGGMATSALVGTICGLYARGGDVPAWVNGGLARTWGERLATLSGTAPTTWTDGLWFLPYDAFAFRRMADDVVAEAGVRTLLHTGLCGVRREGEQVVGVDVVGWDRPLAITTSAVVDTTGNGLAATLAGAPVLADGPHQAGAVVWAMAPVAEVAPYGLHLEVLKAVRSAIADDTLSEAAAAVSLVPGSARGGQVLLKLGLRHRLAAGPEALTAEEQRARRLVEAVADVLVTRAPSFTGARIAQVATQVGVRTGVRPRGRTVLDRDHVLAGASAPDGVARAAWSIEDWGSDVRPALAHLPEGAAYEVPASALEVEGVHGMWTAGRTVSATEPAAASVRVVGTCWATGYAAGQLAAGAVAGRRREDVVAEIRATQVETTEGLP